MKRRLAGLAAVLALALAAVGCGRKIDGPRIWWDDQTRTQLSDDYRLPDDVRAGSEYDAANLEPEALGLRGAE